MKIILQQFVRNYTNIMKRSAAGKRSKTSGTQAKQAKRSSDEAAPLKASTTEDTPTDAVKQYATSLHERRTNTAAVVTEFPYNKKRVRVLSSAAEVHESKSAICYWMSRDMRVQDNWAFLYAQRLALRLELPLVVTFCLVPSFANATMRHYKFLLGGLQEVARECAQLNINFHLLLGPAAQRIPEFVAANAVGAIVCDFAPLRVPLQWVEAVKTDLPDDVPLVQVDAHNIVPVWHASEKLEYSARTIRGKINKKLEEFLTEFPPLIKHSYDCKLPYAAVDWTAAHSTLECAESPPAVDDEVDWAKPGYLAACAQLQTFVARRLSIYSECRNDPTNDAVSGLSPWFHFGQISVQRCVLEVMRLQSKYKASVEAFCEEAIVRRELADNFCYYNKNYDNLDGLNAWARKTLEDHRKDKRSPCYSLNEFEEARTHDDLWNSAQLQLRREGKMHGFLRMYWAKKILEWSESPERALEIAILLNDKYSLDGRDPNGYVGCMWSIGGIHDQGWAERPIFGKIRYMNYKGCERKFNVAAFVAHYGGMIHTKT